MALHPESAPLDEPPTPQVETEDHDAPAYYPPAPPHELFDISTTVDPSYIISLIRKLIPADSRNDPNSPGGIVVVHASDAPIEESTTVMSNESVAMDFVRGFDKSASQGGADEDLCSKSVNYDVSVWEDAWEECGCVLWDLAASITHAELMVENLVLEVLLANLMVSQSMRATEICLGIIGNLACHEVPMKQIVSTNGLIQIIVEKLFLDDTQCLCETFRLLTLGLQSSGCIAWAEALQSERVMCRFLWITENTLNLQLIEKSVGLVLALLESQQEVLHVLLPPLMKLGLPSLLVNLLSYEVNKLTCEKISERYSVLDIILRAIEALSVQDGHSQEICLNKELFELVCNLVKLPDKVEVANSCVTAVVLIANILSDVADLASEIWQDLPFLRGLMDIFPFTLDDFEAQSALWSVIARLLVRVQEDKMSPSDLHQLVSILVSGNDYIEDGLLEHRLGDSHQEQESLTPSGPRSTAITIALKSIINILNHWTASKDYGEEDNVMGEYHANCANVNRLLDFCCKYTGE
ncbi:hypothetical protein CFOL_v3_20198 [Cephalotus follicularis]|uniref:Uncharacterized protein n=1 Tax=Cephalotus follicularis TaxID=3775 RepID=A0A1Q3C918_CEPFO|nr:hypothetical protein CFOL_v3_20198 [Cephalotus follicularis]